MAAFARPYSYENEDVALNTGMILKEMLRYEQLAQVLLHSEQYVRLRRWRPLMPKPARLHRG